MRDKKSIKWDFLRGAKFEFDLECGALEGEGEALEREIELE